MEQKPKLNIMVDLETASKAENAIILSWAMVPFFEDGKEFTEADNFYKVVNMASCWIAGMSPEEDTQQWWMQQDPMAKHCILSGKAESIQSVTSEAYKWLEALSGKYDLHLWCRGLDFDMPKIKWCFRKFMEKKEEELPFKFSHKMDVRTVLKFMQIDQSQFEFEGTKHHSVDDCLHDIKMIQATYKLRDDMITAYTTRLYIRK